MMFDADPEDAYDAGDPSPVRYGVIAALVVDVSAEMADPAHDHRRTLTRISWARFVLERLRRAGVDVETLEARLEQLAALEGP
jgi:hypothetical protein